MTARVDGPRNGWKRAAVAWIAIATALAGCSGGGFVDFVPSPELVPLLGGRSDVQLGGWLPDLDADCPVDEFEYVGAPVDADSSGWKVVIQHVRSETGWAERDVAFATKRFTDRESYDQQWTTLETWFARPCISSDAYGLTQVEPLSLDGLPSEALSASWLEPSSQVDAVSLSAVVADPDHLTMMFVVWTEGPQPLETDDFVKVVNAAWAEFEADNS